MKAKVFSGIDLRLGYYQIPIAEKNSYHIRYGSYGFLVMFVGLTNTPATFYTFMNDIFKEWFDDFVVIYIDNILIYSNFMEKHVEHFQKMFQRLRENKLLARFEKCKFGVMEVDCLGHRITQEGLKMGNHKVKAILDWEPPRSVPTLKSFKRLAPHSNLKWMDKSKE